MGCSLLQWFMTFLTPVKEVQLLSKFDVILTFLRPMFHLHRNLQSWAKYLQQNREIQYNWTGRKSLILLLRVFWLLLPKFNFWKGVWALGYVSTQIWDFPNISLFPKILSLKSFGNSWGNSYTKFAILDITFHFACG